MGSRVWSKGSDSRSLASRFVGSNPTSHTLPHWRNWIAHQTSNLGVVGSSPTWGTFVAVAQHGQERSAFNRVVGGSNPSRDTSHISSVGQSVWLLTIWSWVQVPHVTMFS